MQETAAHKIADVLPSMLGPAAHHDVQVEGDPFALSRGRARAVHIQGQNVQIAPGITLDTLDAEARDVSQVSLVVRLLGESFCLCPLLQFPRHSRYNNSVGDKCYGTEPYHPK